MGNSFKLIASDLDVTPLLKKVLDHDELWGRRTERQSYPGSAHKDTETIYLRWAKDESLFGGFYCLESQDLFDMIEPLAPEVFDVLAETLKHILGAPTQWDVNVGRVILTRMKPGGVITEHIDEGPYADKYERFHVCLQGESDFAFESKSFYSGHVSKDGDLFWFNHKLPHAVYNYKDRDRIHLIIDLIAPEYRKLRGLTFQRERAHELLSEARPLFEAHYSEIAHYQDIPLDINEDAYRQLEEAGILRCFTARYNGELVGYAVYMVRPNLRYQSSIQALQDILFVEKGRRGALIGKRLLDFCKGRLQAEGVQVEYQHSKASPEVKAALAALKRHDVGRFLELQGFELIDLIHGRRLDR